MTEHLNRVIYPNSVEQLRDLPKAIQRYVLPGLVPPKPLVTRADLIFTLGSCFAENLALNLQVRGQPVGHVLMSESINSPLANSIWLKHVINRTPFVTENHARTFGTESAEATRDFITRAKLLVFTAGLAYCPFQDGQFVGDLDKETLRKGRVTFRLTSVEENVAWLKEITGLVCQINPTAPLVYTLSPVPLGASFVEESVIAADCLFKSTLRLALAQFQALGLPGTYYWPSFEIVRWLSGHTQPMYGIDDGQPRHVSLEAIDTIVTLFLQHYVR